MFGIMLVALAQITNPPATIAPQNPDQANKPKVICEYEEEIGSRLAGKRVCHTKEEWAQIRADSRQSLESKQRNYSPQ